MSDFIFTSRRLSAFSLRLVGRHPADYAQDLQEALEQLWDQGTRGIPGGFNAVDPTTVQAGATASPGTEGQGWAAADHTHPVETAAAVDLGNANSEGVGSALARADHVHKRSVRVKVGANDFTRNALVLIAGSGILITSVDDSVGDEVEVTVAVSPAVTEEARRLAYQAMVMGGL